MLKPALRRLRLFMGADLAAELHAIRIEIVALRAELAARDEKENALAKQMEAALLTIALNRGEFTG